MDDWSVCACDCHPECCVELDISSHFALLSSVTWLSCFRLLLLRLGQAYFDLVVLGMRRPIAWQHDAGVVCCRPEMQLLLRQRCGGLSRTHADRHRHDRCRRCRRFVARFTPAAVGRRSNAVCSRLLHCCRLTYLPIISSLSSSL